MTVTRYIPRTLSLGNAAFGFLAIAAIGAGRPVAAAGCIAAAFVCDALDGRLARRLGAASPLGVELDSLADAVSFGAAPAFAVLHAGQPTALAVAAGIVYLAATLYRLARFNVSNDPSADSHRWFAGMPCTAGAAIVLACAIAAPAYAPIAACGAAILMASRVPFPHVLALLERHR